MCFTCSPKVLTPLNSPWVGAKLNLSSGMASAAETTSFSTLVRLRSRTIANVGFWSGWACVAPCELAATVAPEAPIASTRIAIATCLFMKTASTEDVMRIEVEYAFEYSSPFRRLLTASARDAAGTTGSPEYRPPDLRLRRTVNGRCQTARQFLPTTQRRRPTRLAEPAGTWKWRGRACVLDTWFEPTRSSWQESVSRPGRQRT